MSSSGDRSFMGRAVVGLDLDGVCADYISGFRPYAAKHLGVEPATLLFPRSYDLVEEWGFRDYADYREAHKRAVSEGMYSCLPPIEGISCAAQRLSESGAHIRIVTHRLFLGGSHRRIVSDTAAWLDANRIPYMSLCFTGLKDSVGAHLYVEDSPDSVVQLRGQGWPTFVFDQPYNAAIPGPRIFSWDTGVVDLITSLGDLGQLSD